MSELNPNHKVTRQAHDQWHKICALVMLKLGARTVELTMDEITSMLGAGNINIVIDEKVDRLIVSLVDDKKAAELARREDGLPA